MENTAAVKRWGAAAGLAWLSSLAFSLDVLDPVARAKEQSVEGMALTVLLAVFYHWAMEKTPADSRQQRRMLPLAALLGLFTLTGLSMEASDSLAFLYSGLVCLAKAAAVWAGYAVLIYFCLRAVFYGLDRLAASPGRSRKGPGWLKMASPKTVLCSMGVILLCWLPYYICLFPGASNSDTWWQLEQVTGVQPLNAGHPLLHTFLQSGLILAGKTLLGSWNAGVFLAVLVQSLSMAAVLAYSVHFLVRLNVQPVLPGLLLALYGLVPTFPRSATILMKDTPYSFSVLLFTVLVLEEVLLPQQFAAKRYKKPLAALAAFLVCTMRYNGPVLLIGVLLFSGPALWKTAKSGRARAALAAWLVLPLVLGYGISAGLKALPGVEQANPNETLSVPLQQTGRFVRDFGDEVTDEEREVIDRVVQYDQLAEVYTPWLADPIKSYINREDATDADRAAYRQVWMAQTLRHPVNALEAFVNLNYGWVYPGVTNPCWSYSPVADNDYVTRPALLDRLEALLDKADFAFLLPVTSWFENLGLAAWGLLALGAWLSARRVKGLGGALSMQYLTLLMCLFGPVFFGHGRYGWPLLFCWPVLLAAAIFAARRNGGRA